MLTSEQSVELLKLRKLPKLNPKGAARLAELEKQNLPETSFGERALIGMGRGMLDIGQGIKQKGLMAGEALGLADPGAAEAYTQQVNREMLPYQRLSEAHPWSTGAGRIGGNIAAAPIPGFGAGLSARLLTSGLLGAGVGATEFTPSGRACIPMSPTLFGGGGGLLGEAGGAALGRAFTSQPARGGLPMAEAVGSLGGRETGGAFGPALPPPPQAAAAFTPEYQIPLTAGQASRSIPAQQFEQRVLRGNALGDPAQRQLDEFLQGQQAAVNEAYDEATGRVSANVAEEVTGDVRGAPLQAVEGLRGRAGALMDDVDEAFEAARGAGAQLRVDDARGVFDSMRGLLGKAELNAPAVYPKTHEFLEEMESFIPDMPEMGPHLIGVDIEGMHALRQVLGDRIAEAGKGDKRALSRMKRQLDNEMLRLADEGRLIGDPEGLYALREGIQLRADYGRLYGPREAARRRSGRRVTDPAGKAIEDIIEDTTLASDDITRKVFGTSLGGNQNTREILRRVEQIAGRDSQEYNLMRLAAMDQLRRETLQAGENNISPAKFRTKWNKLREKNRDLLDQLFEPDQIEEVNTLLREYNMAGYDPKALNPSQTAFMLENIMRRSAAPAMGAAAGGAAAGLGGAAAGATASLFAAEAGRMIRDGLGRAFAQRIYRPPVVRTPAVGGLAGRGVGLEAGRQYEERRQ